MSRRVDLTEGGRTHRADIDGSRVAVGGSAFDVTWRRDGQLRLANGSQSEEAWTASQGDTIWVFRDGRVHVFERNAGGWRPATAGRQASLAAPMPASVRQVLVRPGQAVRTGEVLILLEAMKMELPVRAAADGVVRDVRCRPGELVQPGVPLLEVDPA